jgi:hypothetical protein
MSSFSIDYSDRVHRDAAESRGIFIDIIFCFIINFNIFK